MLSEAFVARVALVAALVRTVLPLAVPVPIWILVIVFPISPIIRTPKPLPLR